MTAVFADSFYYLAVMNADDAAHERAVRVSDSLGGPVVTTAWVLTEVADALAAPGQRSGFLALLEALRGDRKSASSHPTKTCLRRASVCTRAGRTRTGR